MQAVRRVSAILFRVLSTNSQMSSTSTAWISNRYPQSRRSDRVDIYQSETTGQVHVPDPYHWLESNTEETEKWTTAQQAFTRAYLDQNPHKQNLEDQIRSNTDYAKIGTLSLKNDNRWYWYYNSGLQAQFVIYRSKNEVLPVCPEGQEPEGEVFFDPNLLSQDGTVSLAKTAFSRCGKYWAYAISFSGSDYCNVYVRRTSSPLVGLNGKRPDHRDERFPEEIRFVKFSALSWTLDSKGFFYQRYPERTFNGNTHQNNPEIKMHGDLNAMIYYHRIGTSQADDVLVMKDDVNPEWIWITDVSHDGKYLVLHVVRDTSRKNQLWIADLENNEIGPDMKWDKVIDEFDAEYDFIHNVGSKLYIRTNKSAPRYRVITVDLADPNREMKELIPEDKDARLGDVAAVNNGNLVAVYTRNVNDEVHIFEQDGTHVRRLAPDFLGSALISCRPDQSWLFVFMSGFTTPGSVARYEFEKEESKRWSIYRTILVNGLRPEDFETRQVWYESKDGTKVPMFIVRHKSTKFDGTAPAIQYGYGGFSASINPFFRPSILTFLKMYGAIFAVPNIRGGAEFGENWHLAGTRERKVNTFDDFIAATQYLVEHKYAAPGKVAINGSSNGGLLVSACINRAPEGTFGAAVADVGVHDLLKFSEFTIGKAWVSDYGDPQDSHDFDFIYPISPLHNVPRDKVLPPTILLTADHDDRVVPMHTFKHAATLQNTLPHNPHPLLVRIDKKAGHGAGKTTEQIIKEDADKWGFVAQSMGLGVASL